MRDFYTPEAKRITLRGNFEDEFVLQYCVTSNAHMTACECMRLTANVKWNFNTCS